MTLALITGASSGIGEALAVELAKRRYDLILCGRDTVRLEQLASRLRQQARVETFLGDLSLAKDRALLVNLIHRQAPDLVVNNAGMGLYGDALSYPTAEQMEIIELNVSALAELTLEAGRALVSAGKSGVIMNISSVAATPVMPLFSLYSASKAFVNQLSECLDFEWRPHGIRVLASCPGRVRTHFQQRAAGVSDTEKQASGFAAPMTAEFAAQEILKQIDAGQRIRAFGFIYRLTNFVCRYVLPKSWVAASVAADIRKRAGARSLILLSNHEK